MDSCQLCGRSSNQPTGTLFHKNGYHKQWAKPPALLIRTLKVGDFSIRVCAECITKEDLNIPDECH